MNLHFKNLVLIFLVFLSGDLLFAQKHAGFTSPVQVCENAEIVFRSNSVVAGATINEYHWDLDGDGVFDKTTTVDTLASVYYADVLSKKYGGQHSFDVQLRIVTSKNDTLLSAKRTVKVNYVPVLTNSNTSYYDTVACKLDTLKFFNNYFVSEGTIENTYWYFNNADETYTQTFFKRAFTKAGKYTVKTLAITDKNCRNSSEGTIRIKEIPEGTLSYSGDTTFYNDKNIDITAVGKFSSLIWSTGETTPKINVNQSGYYTASIKNDEGCVIKLRSSKINVLIENKLQATNMLTLNDDGKNDGWKILEIEAYGVCEVHVFDRNGSEVFTSKDYKNDWNGKDASGEKIPAGTYYYTIKASELKDIIKGTINILH
jgi:gliding motility-associated-like protein